MSVVILSITSALQDSAKIEIGYNSMLSLKFIPYVESKLNSNGKCNLTFTIDKPSFATLKISDQLYDMYIEPGFSLSISIDTANRIHYSGIGAEANNYLAEASHIEKIIEQHAGRNLAELNKDEFLINIDSLDLKLKRFHKHFIDTVEISNGIKSILEKRNRMRVLVFKQAFVWNYSAIHESAEPTYLYTSSNIPDDSILLNTNHFNYAILLHMDKHIKLNSLMRGAKTEVERIEKANKIPLLMISEIDSCKLSHALKEFQLAKNIYFWIDWAGVTPRIDSLFSEFKNQYLHSSYLQSLEPLHKKAISLLPGKPAPSIKGVTLDSDTIELSVFIGKVLYIDIWASWCGPCISEIPFSIKNQDTFKGDDSIVFVNISVDKDYNDWKKSVLKHKDWKGLHLLSDQSIYETYQINGIPRYILIDKGGRIVSSDALRPSDKDIEKEIRKLL